MNFFDPDGAFSWDAAISWGIQGIDKGLLITSMFHPIGLAAYVGFHLGLGDCGGAADALLLAGGTYGVIKGIGRLRGAARAGGGALRQTYKETAEELGAMAQRLRAGGMSAEEVVRTVSPLRNALKMNIRSQGNWFAARLAHVRNVIKYGNRAGPSPESLLGKYGSWDGALDAISRTNRTVNRIMGAQ